MLSNATWLSPSCNELVGLVAVGVKIHEDEGDECETWGMLGLAIDEDDDVEGEYTAAEYDPHDETELEVVKLEGDDGILYSDEYTEGEAWKGPTAGDELSRRSVGDTWVGKTWERLSPTSVAGGERTTGAMKEASRAVGHSSTDPGTVVENGSGTGPIP